MSTLFLFQGSFPLTQKLRDLGTAQLIAGLTSILGIDQIGSCTKAQQKKDSNPESVHCLILRILLPVLVHSSTNVPIEKPVSDTRRTGTTVHALLPRRVQNMDDID